MKSGADLRVRQAVTRQPGDRGLLGSQLGAALVAQPFTVAQLTPGEPSAALPSLNRARSRTSIPSAHSLVSPS